jgi:hypothetical protein
VAGPFFFHWVEPTENIWSSEFEVWDENIFDFVIEHTEGNFPTLTITVPNPFEGFLNPGRLFWAWFAWEDPTTSHVWPLFFGRLVGVPTDLVNQTVQMKFIARPTNYIAAKQLVAETLKVAPYYDPIWIPLAKRDDPDTILEGWSSLYHIDRVSLDVTTSDILIGEDGTQNFGGGTAFYDSVKLHRDQPGLVAVNVAANVTWDQEYEGNFPVVSGAMTTYTGEGFINDWPKTGSGLGGGYTVGVGWAANADSLIRLASTLGGVGYTFNYTNLAKKHHNGDVMSQSLSYSHPAVPIPGITKTVFLQDIVGIIDPTAVDANGDPAPINIPAKVHWVEMTAASWNVSYHLSIIYKAKRKRAEWMFLTLQSDVQPIDTDLLVTQNTEQITLSSSNLSLPELTLLNWSSVAGQPVSLGEMVFPDNPLVAGQTSTQIAVQAGTAGLIEPIFSNIAGTTTNDGSVVWSSLGSTPPQETAGDWNRSVNVGLGTLLVPLPMIGKDLDSLIAPGLLSWPPVGVLVSEFDLFSHGLSVPGGLMFDCTQGGMAGGPVDSPGNPATATFQSFTNPTGAFMYIATQAGQTGEFHTTFDETPGSVTSDGTVKWTNIGRVNLPIGGWPGFTGASAYFPTDRGLQSAENLICRARAKLRKRARAVTGSWETPFSQMVTMSCRKNATIADPRISGGIAGGKVIAYKMMGNGDTSVFKGQVNIGCSIGLGDHLSFTAGTPQYTAGTGYAQPGYQAYTGAVIPAAAEDVGFTPPVPQATDDGLVFPLTADQAILTSTFHGSLDAEALVIEEAFQQAVFDGINGFPFSITVAGQNSVTISNTEANFPAVQAAIDDAAAQGTGPWYELAMRPLTNGPFSAAYTLQTTKLVLPQTINLEAAGSP